MKDNIYPLFGFDIDDVCFRTYDVLADQLRKQFGVHRPSPNDFTELENLLDPIDYRNMINFCLIDRANDLVPVDGACEFISKYQFTTGNKIIFVTSREISTKEATEFLINKWMPDLRYQVRYIKEECISKGDIAEAEGMDVFLEDRVKYALDVAGHGCMVLMLGSSWNTKYQDPYYVENIFRIKDFDEVNLIFHIMNVRKIGHERLLYRY